MYRLLALVSIFAATAFSADVMGTWKLNTAKSKATVMQVAKEMTVTYTPEGSGWRYAATGATATGQKIESRFTFVKDGADIKTTGFPYWDSLVLNNTNSNKAEGTLKREGKAVGTVVRTLSADGKTMTLRGKVTMPDGKQATYTSVYEKQ